VFKPSFVMKEQVDHASSGESNAEPEPERVLS